MTEVKISWSGLRSHTECHQKSFLQRTGKKAKMEDQRVFFPGTVTDRVVRDWLLGEPLDTLGKMPEMVESYVQKEQEKIENSGKKLIWRDSEDRDRIIEECKLAVTEIEPFLLKYVVPYEYDVDFKFEAPIKARHPETGDEMVILLIGFMDIIVKRDDGSWYVYDVKHTKDEYYWKKTRGQLSFYDLAVDIMFSSPTAEVALLQPLCKEKLKGFVLSEDDRTILLKQVLDMANDIWNNEVTPTSDTGPCYFCNVKHACTKFSPVRAKDGSKRVNLLSKRDSQ